MCGSVLKGGEVEEGLGWKCCCVGFLVCLRGVLLAGVGFGGGGGLGCEGNVA